MINESLLQLCGKYHSQTISETNTRPQRTQELKTHVFTDNREGLHDTRSVDSLTLGARCQFSQNIHDFSQEICCLLKLMVQHDKWKSSSVLWWISLPDNIWNKHTTTKKTCVFIDNKEGLHDMLSADSLTAGASASGSAGAGWLACTLSVCSWPVLNSSAWPKPNVSLVCDGGCRYTLCVVI